MEVIKICDGNKTNKQEEVSKIDNTNCQCGCQGFNSNKNDI